MGPLLFNIFVNDMFESTTCKLDAYADDLTLTTNGSKNVIKIINGWLKIERFLMLTSHLMLLGTDNLTRSAGDTHVTMRNTVITKTSTENLLGCYIDQNIK